MTTPNPSRRHSAPPAPVDREPQPTPAPPPADNTCRIRIAEIVVEGSGEILRSTLAELSKLIRSSETRPARDPRQETRG